MYLKFKSAKVSLFSLFILCVLTFPASALAEKFWVTGTVKRVLTNSTHYGGCMIMLDKAINNSCPANGWVSLDCDGQFNTEKQGERAYATALVAFSMSKKLSVYINNAQKHDGYCVAERLDIVG